MNNLILNYFIDIFSGNPGDNNVDSILQCVQPIITTEDNNNLVTEFTREEFQDAVNQMHPDKSPGPDGFNPAFYQKFWPIIGDDIFKACVHWLSEGSFPSKLNDTCVTLIPKCDNPVTVKDLRPISLCNVYKILSKVLCNRLKRVLPTLIDKAQSAFVAGRSI